MSDSKEIDRFSRAVAVLKQGIESVETYLEKVPAPALLQLHSIEDIPQSVREQIKQKLWRIFIYGEYPLATMWSNFDEPLLINSGWQFTYYGETYKPISEKIRKLIDVSMVPERKTVEIAVVEECDFLASRTPGQTLASEIEDHMDDYEYLALDDWVGNFVIRHIENCSAGTDHPSSDMQNPILSCFKSVFTVMYDYQWQIEYEKGCQNFEPADIAGNETTDVEEDVEEKQKREACEVDLSDFEKVIKKRYFKPDDWAENEEDLMPIIVAKKLGSIPRPIQNRVEEIYNSYIFGNWIAVIALSRCLLEYVLHHVGPSYGINVYLTDAEILEIERIKGKGKVRTDKNMRRDLVAMIKKVTPLFPTLHSGMKAIRETGNNVMHPTSPYKRKNGLEDLGNIYVHNQNDARECLTHIIKITTTLYTNLPNPPLKPSPK